MGTPDPHLPPNPSEQNRLEVPGIIRNLQRFTVGNSQQRNHHRVMRDLSVSLGRLGDVETAAGNLAEARKHFQRSLDIDEEMVEQDPTNASLKFDLVLSHGNLFVLDQGQDAAASKRHLLAADKLLTELADSGHLEGWAEREQVRKIVTKHLDNLDP